MTGAGISRVLRGAVVAAGLVLVTGAAACTPETSGPPTTTLPPIAVGCHDGLGADLYFNGPIDAVDNADIHGTNNGTCGSFVAKRTLVQAADKAAADALCTGIGKSSAINEPLDDPSFGYVTLVAAWECY